MLVKWFFRRFFPLTEITQFKDILAVQPHADDLDIALGGTIAMLAERGARITCVTVTDDIGQGPEGTQSIRRKEQEEAGKISGVSDFIWLGYPDAGYWDEEALRRDLMRIMNRVKPDLILYPDPTLTFEAHPDHLKTGRAAAAAALLFPYFSSDGAAAVPPPAGESTMDSRVTVGMYFSDKPNTFIRCGKYRGQKYRAIAKHSSQFDEKGFKSLRLYDTFHGRYTGLFRGSPYVEGIKVLPATLLHCIPEASRY